MTKKGKPISDREKIANYCLRAEEEAQLANRKPLLENEPAALTAKQHCSCNNKTAVTNIKNGNVCSNPHVTAVC